MTQRFARLLAALAFAVCLFVPSTSAAVYQCGPDKDDCQCGMNNPYPCCDNGGNCTWWAWEKACCNWSVGLPGWGNANQWSGNAKAHPNYDVLSQPVVNSIATRVSGSYGHVAWVTAVNGSSITVSQQNCWGGWGHETSSFNPGYFDGGFVVPKSLCECQPGETQTESCGNCGEKKRSCSNGCQWGSWGECGGQGECTPGDTGEKACGECGHQSRKCKSDCSWGAYDTCNGLDPEAVTACDTGEDGECAKGTQQCVDGAVQCVASATSKKEICDGLDNDCDGWIDDGTSCGGISKDGGAAPNSESNNAQETDTSKLDGGCSLAPTRKPSVSFALVLSCLALFFARRARRPRH